MPYREYALPLRAEYLQTPVLSEIPAAVELDLSALLRPLGRPGLTDLSSIRLETAAGRVPAQFSPAEDFNALERCRGTLVFLAPAAAAPVLRGDVRFGATDDLQAQRLPYPPRSYRHLLSDGRAAPPAYFPCLQLVPQPGGRLDVEEDGRLVTAYHHGAGEPRPYLFPLIGPAGRGLTRLGHPHDPGETHSHHHSLWVGFHGVNGESFWEERHGGQLVHQEFERLEDGAACARFLSRVEWRSRAGKPVLRERRDVTIYPAARGARLLDFSLGFQGADGEARLEKTSFGFLAVRVAKSMGVFDGGGIIRNSEGGINEPGVFWKRAKWCDYSGPVTPEGWNGIAFLDHPANPRHPTPWHVRPDGWMGAAFATEAAHTIPARQWLELRYRFYLHAGTAPEAHVESAWHDYAHPPRVTLGQARIA